MGVSGAGVGPAVGLAAAAVSTEAASAVILHGGVLLSRPLDDTRR
jgi:hypothetical protein